MGDNLKEQLQKARAGKKMYESYTKRIDEIQQKIWESENQLAHLETAYEKEVKDVTKLEQGSISSFFFKVSGKYNQALEKEAQEAEVAKLQLTQKKKELKKLKETLDDLKKERFSYAQCEHEYTQLYNIRLTELKNGNGLIHQKLQKIEEEIAYYESQIKEIKEALMIGKQVISVIEQVNKSLDKAAGWGTFDILGGGVVSDLAKHSHLDDAKHYAQEAQGLMGNFKTELADVGQMTLDIHIDIGSFAKFADFFCDGFFADLYMQDRIKEAQRNAENAYSQVASVCNQLESLVTKLADEITCKLVEQENLVVESE